MAINLHIRNLPRTANNLDIRRFFIGLDIPEGGVQIVGGQDGDAFVAFTKESDLLKALNLNDRQLLGQHLKLFLAKRSDMEKVIAKRSKQLLEAKYQKERSPGKDPPRDIPPWAKKGRGQSPQAAPHDRHSPEPKRRRYTEEHRFDHGDRVHDRAQRGRSHDRDDHRVNEQFFRDSAEKDYDTSSYYGRNASPPSSQMNPPSGRYKSPPRAKYGSPRHPDYHHDSPYHRHHDDPLGKRYSSPLRGRFDQDEREPISDLERQVLTRRSRSRSPRYQQKYSRSRSSSSSRSGSRSRSGSSASSRSGSPVEESRRGTPEPSEPGYMVVTNLPYTVTAKDLRDCFKEFPIADGGIALKSDESDSNVMLAYVKFTTIKDAVKVDCTCEGLILHGKAIQTNLVSASVFNARSFYRGAKNTPQPAYTAPYQAGPYTGPPQPGMYPGAVQPPYMMPPYARGPHPPPPMAYRPMMPAYPQPPRPYAPGAPRPPPPHGAPSPRGPPFPPRAPYLYVPAAPPSSKAAGEKNRNLTELPRINDSKSTSAVLSTGAAPIKLLQKKSEKFKAARAAVLQHFVGDTILTRFYVRLTRLPNDATASNIWHMLGGATGPAEGVILFVNNLNKPIHASIAFESEEVRDKQKSTNKFLSTKCCRSAGEAALNFFAQELIKPRVKIFESTPYSFDRLISHEEKIAAVGKLKQGRSKMILGKLAAMAESKLVIPTPMTLEKAALFHAKKMAALVALPPPPTPAEQMDHAAKLYQQKIASASITPSNVTILTNPTSLKESTSKDSAAPGNLLIKQDLKKAKHILRFVKLQPGATACEVWSWFDGPSGPSPGVIMVCNDESTPIAAYVGFNQSWNAFKDTMRSDRYAVSSYENMIWEIRTLKENYQVFESRPSGVDRQVDLKEIKIAAAKCAPSLPAQPGIISVCIDHVRYPEDSEKDKTQKVATKSPKTKPTGAKASNLVSLK